MQDLRNALGENLGFYRDQERLISARLAVLPKGRIKAQTKGREIYHYLQYRKGKAFRSDYIGKSVPSELRDQLEERERLQKELRRVREGLRSLRAGQKKGTDLIEPLHSILRALTEEDLWESGLEIIGSWCFLLYQRHLPMDKYPLRTEDLDILVPLPYKGKSFDIGNLLKGLGFRQDFHADGSMSFSGNLMKVEFLAPEKGTGRGPAQFIREIAVTPQLLRFVDILFSEPIILGVSKGIKAKVPSPAAFALHKFVIATRFKRRDKMDKDLRQAVISAKYVLSDKSETQKLARMWDSFPRGWKKRVHAALKTAQDLFPLEQGAIQAVQKVLV